MVLYLRHFTCIVYTASDAAVVTASVATAGAWNSSVQTEMLLIPIRSESRGFYTTGVCIQRDTSRQLTTSASPHQVTFDKSVDGAHSFCHFIIDNRDGEVLMMGSLLPGKEDPVPDVVSFLQACASGSPAPMQKRSAGPTGRPSVRCIWWSPRGGSHGSGLGMSDQPRQQRLSAVLDRNMLVERRFMNAVLCCSFTESAVRTKCPECYLQLDVDAPCTCARSQSLAPAGGFQFARDIQHLGGTFVGSSVMTWRRPGARKLSVQNQFISLSLSFTSNETSVSHALRDMAPAAGFKFDDAVAKQPAPVWYANLLDLEATTKPSQAESFFNPEMYLGAGMDDLCLPLGDAPDVASVEDLGRLLFFNNDAFGASVPVSSIAMSEDTDSLSQPASPPPMSSPAYEQESTVSAVAPPAVCPAKSIAESSKPVQVVDPARKARAEIRKTKNREAARRSNLRRKQRNDYLKAAVKESRTKLTELRNRQLFLRKANETLRARLRSAT